MNDASAEVISQMRTLLRSVQPQLAPDSAARDLAKIACSLADDWMAQLNEETAQLRSELGAGPQEVSPPALSIAP